jgi:ParB/RepB/Spo0J family partition protein
MSTETATFNDALPLAKLHESKWNPRRTFDAAKLAELTASIQAKGVVTPLLVRPNASGYEIGAGYRRYRAAKAAGVATVPALIRPMTDEEFLELVVFENDEREDVHPLEEAAGYRTMMKELKWDVGRIAQRTGKSEKYVYDRVKLLALIPEAQKLFLENAITAGHAILLARLKAEDQKRILEPEDRDWSKQSVLLREDAVLLPPDQEDTLDEKKLPLKPISVRELERYIAEHVRFKPSETDAFLFPETAAAVQAATETKKKIVEITHLSFIPEEAREGRTIRAGFWKYAGGKKGKACDYAVTGVIVVGPEQGQAFPVCVNREKCRLHWGKEIAAKEKAAKSPAKKTAPARDDYNERWKREQAAREAAQARWKKALPKILEAVAACVKKAPLEAGGLLSTILLDEVGGYGGARVTTAAEYVARGSTVEDLVRHAVFAILVGEAQEYNAPDQFHKRAKAFGVDLKKILDAAAPVEKPAASRMK